MLLDYIAKYGFDLAGNRIQKLFDKAANGSVDETTTYSYDANDRLTSEIFNSTTNSLDRSTFYTYNGTEQTEQKVYTGIHSSPPGPTAHKTTTSTYDVQGRLASVTVADFAAPTTVTSYKYNHQGVRVEQTLQFGTDPSFRTVYHIDPLNQTGYSQVLEEGVDVNDDRRLQAGEIDRSYVIGHTVIAQQAPDFEGGGTFYLLKDGHGNTRTFA